MGRKEEKGIEEIGEDEKSFCCSPNTMVRIIVF